MDSKPHQPQGVYNTTPGPALQLVHVGRQMKVYPINENELMAMGQSSAEVTFASSAITLVLGIAVSVCWDLANTTDAGTITRGKIVLAVCVAVIVIFAIKGIMAHRANKSLLQRILNEVVKDS